MVHVKVRTNEDFLAGRLAAVRCVLSTYVVHFSHAFFQFILPLLRCCDCRHYLFVSPGTVIPTYCVLLVDAL